MESGGVSRTATPSARPNGTGAAAATNSKPMKICVYCGSSGGKNPAHLEAARELGTLMAKKNINLVYGGGTVGLMGEVARTIVAINGPDAVHGIIPEALVKWERDDATYATYDRERGYYVPDAAVYGRTTVVKDMHTRKYLMAKEIADAAPGSGFVALSGGYGTMEELMETVTWNQLNIHQMGVCVLNVDGFYDGLLAWIKTAVREGFVRKENADIMVTATTAQGAIDALGNYKVSKDQYNLSWGTLGAVNITDEPSNAHLR
ncbi:lysine decarboxylase [Microdochium trichocladiopsis]|uniref:Lysine decarboxylase n=1 Tax=Microdochium trichocladiopsis TaxID=1682393 RepID=A0A9P8YBV7_9PEZI|nr:lysine decarboxylase [Microdochium trichocladiopsis]KAH7033337.1 lysine decarboxylase [Microdochium trichocladiopsis]